MQNVIEEPMFGFGLANDSCMYLRCTLQKLSKQNVTWDVRSRLVLVFFGLAVSYFISNIFTFCFCKAGENKFIGILAGLGDLNRLFMIF